MEDEVLDFDFILSDDEVKGFLEEEEKSETSDNEEYIGTQDDQEEEEEEEKKVYSPNSNKTQEDDEDDDIELGDSAAFYKEITKALHEDGIFSNIEDLDSIDSPERFAEAIEAQIQARMDYRYKRIDEALNFNVPVEKIKEYESTIQYIDSINPDDLSKEGEEFETLRKNIIYQDYINRGFSSERATREVQKSVSGGNDVTDAIEALSSNREYFENLYNTEIAQRRHEEELRQQQQQAYIQDLQNKFEKGSYFNGLDIDSDLRKKAFNTAVVPYYRDDEGNVYTELQKFQAENPDRYIFAVSTLYNLTKGFSDFSQLVGKQLNKEKKSSIRRLQETLSGSYNTGGTPKFMNPRSNSSTGKGWDLDI